jgi:hypothetical protein
MEKGFPLLQVVWLWILLYCNFYAPAAIATAVAAAAEGDNTNVCHDKDDNDGTCATPTSTSKKESSLSLLSCQSQFSQTSLAVAMAQQSSPRGSPSHVKLRQILTHHQNFYLDFGDNHHQGLFDAVAINMIAAFEGYGLTLVTKEDGSNKDNNTGTLRVEALFSPHRLVPNDIHSPLFLQQPQTAVIILQTEQVCCTPYGQRMLPYMQLCHASPKCLLWEYSSRNWEWFQEQGIADSVMLLPILHQHRLNPYYNNNNKDDDDEAAITPLHQRPMDVVFFGIMTPRRQQLQVELEKIAQQQNWNLVLEQVENSGSRLEYMANSYQNAKICLIFHSFFTTTTSDKKGTPGEYHRLSELAPSGCVPVVEAFGDVLIMTTNNDDDDDDDDGKHNDDVMDDFYGRCGGVVFADLKDLVGTIQAVLYSIIHGNHRLQQLVGDSLPELAAKVDQLPSMEDRLAWWNNVIQWEVVLKLILEEGKERK